LRFLKYLLALFGFIVLFIVLIIAVLNSSGALDFIAKQALSKSSLDIKYDSLEGDIFSGIRLKGVDFENKAKADLELKVDFQALKEKTLHIEKLKITDIFVEKDFLKSLIDQNSSKSEKKGDKELFFKDIVVDDLEVGIDSLIYKEYEIDFLALRVKNFKYDRNSDINGDIDFDLNSNIAKSNALLTIRNNRYKGDIKLKPKRDFLNKILKEHNTTLQKTPNIDLKLDGDLKKSDFDLKFSDFALKYQKYLILPKQITINGDFDFESYDLAFKSDLLADSNVAFLDMKLESSLNLKDINNTLTYDASADISALKEEFAKILDQKDLKFVNSSKIDLKLKGDMKKADILLTLLGGEIVYDKFVIHPKNLNLKSSYGIKDTFLTLEADALIESNAADFTLDLSGDLNLKDINHTLRVDLKSDLLAKKEFFSDILKEKNITVTKIPSVHIDSKTSDSKIEAFVLVDESFFMIEDLKLNPKKIRLDALYNLKNQDLRARLLSDILSNAADISLDANLSSNNLDFNKTLKYTLKSEVKAKEEYLKSKLKREDVDFKKLSALILNINGDAKKLYGDLFLNGEAKVGNYKIKPDIKRADFSYDLKNNEIVTDIKAKLKSTPLDLDIESHVQADIDDINDSLKYRAKIFIDQKRVFNDLDLRQLGKIDIDAKGSLKEVDAKISSKKINATVSSDDFDRFDLFLDTKKLYMDKIYKKAPPELKNSMISLNAKGFYSLKKTQADIYAKIKDLRFSKRNIKTNRFRLKMDGKDFFVSPLNIRAKDFSLTLKAASKEGKITAEVRNKAINADIKFSQKPLFADARVDIPSISKLIKQIDKVYPLKDIPKIDGSLRLNAESIQEQKIKIELTSPKISFEQGRFEKIDILAFYMPTRAKISRFDFDLRGFEPKEMNRHIGLKKEALFTFEGDNASADIEFENLFKFKGSKKKDLILGDLKCKKLYLAAKDYGKTKLTADVQMFQSAKQLAVSADVTLEETELVYESRVLDVSKDPDIIIIDKSKKKKRLADDSFVQNTFLDLRIKSKDEITYKMEAGTIILKPDMEIRKDFGSNVKILGKVNILDGEYDFGDKRFKLKEGAIAFRGLKEVNPLLDLHVEYEIEDVIIYIDILGDKRKPKLLFKSKPMMSKKDIFSYLLFGFAVSESDGAQSSAANAAEKIFGRALAKDLARELKLDKLDLTREEGGGVNIKAGKKLNKKTIIYYQNRSQESSVIVERKVGKHFLLDTEIGQSSQAVDLIYKKGYK